MINGTQIIQIDADDKKISDNPLHPRHPRSHHFSSALAKIPLPVMVIQPNNRPINP